LPGFWPGAPYTKTIVPPAPKQCWVSFLQNVFAIPTPQYPPSLVFCSFSFQISPFPSSRQALTPHRWMQPTSPHLRTGFFPPLCPIFTKPWEVPPPPTCLSFNLLACRVPYTHHAPFFFFTGHPNRLTLFSTLCTVDRLIYPSLFLSSSPPVGTRLSGCYPPFAPFLEDDTAFQQPHPVHPLVLSTLPEAYLAHHPPVF